MLEEAHKRIDSFITLLCAYFLQDSSNPSYNKVFRRIIKTRGQIELHRIYGPVILKEVVQGKAVVIADRGSFTYKVT